MRKSLLDRLRYIERKQSQLSRRNGRKERMYKYVTAIFRMYAESLKTKE
ncbi:hypothetical protein J2T13_000209 [Paenibacillus sp. DS2015]